jgi:hypothetical protein
MLNIKGVKVYTQDELLDNLSIDISKNVGDNDWMEHIDMISGYVAAMINESEHYVQGYLKKALRLER